MSDNNPAVPVDGPTPDLVRFRWSFEGMLPAPKGYQPGFVRGSDYDAATTAARTEAERARKQRDQLLAALTELVECHRMKYRLDNADRMTSEIKAIADDYRRRKPLAWTAAERLIAGDKTE